jgi:hypothetical protein
VNVVEDREAIARFLNGLNCETMDLV